MKVFGFNELLNLLKKCISKDFKNQSANVLMYLLRFLWKKRSLCIHASFLFRRKTWLLQLRMLIQSSLFLFVSAIKSWSPEVLSASPALAGEELVSAAETSVN